jgi:hypothetical protein
MWDANLSFFPLGPPVYVCAALLWGKEGRVHFRVTACSICSPGPLSTASSSSEALDEIELLRTTGCLAVRLSMWHPWQKFLNWTGVTWFCRFATITISLDWLGHFITHTHALSTGYCYWTNTWVCTSATSVRKKMHGAIICGFVYCCLSACRYKQMVYGHVFQTIK